MTRIERRLEVGAYARVQTPDPDRQDWNGIVGLIVYISRDLGGLYITHGERHAHFEPAELTPCEPPPGTPLWLAESQIGRLRAALGMVQASLLSWARKDRGQVGLLHTDWHAADYIETVLKECQS